MTSKSSKNSAMTASRMNFSGYVEHVTTCVFICIFGLILSTACCSPEGLGLGLILSVWLFRGYAHVFTLLSVVNVRCTMPMLRY